MVSEEIVHVEPLLPMSVEQAKEAMETYQELTRTLLTAEDWQGMPGRDQSFVKRRGWAKLATFYGVSTELLREDIERDEAGRPTRARVVARAIHPNGRHADGDGACSIEEARFSSEKAKRNIQEGKLNLEHDLPATAATRAVNRAISNLIGFGAVSAEEVDGAASQTSQWGQMASEDDRRDAAAAVQKVLPSLDGYQFVHVLARAFGDGVPEAAVRTLKGLAWFVEQPEATGSQRAEQAPENAPADQSPYHEGPEHPDDRWRREHPDAQRYWGD